MTRRSRIRPIAAALVVAGIAGVASCGTTGSGSATPTRPITSAATSTIATSAPATTTTAPAATAVFGTPTAAAKALFSRWTAKDRAGAAAFALAPASELDHLFSHAALTGAKLRTCDDGAFGPATCFFGNGQGGVSVTLHRAGTGWSITNIDAY